MEVKVLDKEQGSASDVIDQDGFKVHDIMFSYRDLVQCLILCSTSLVENISSPYVNAIMVTINRKEKNIICAPMMYNRYFSRKLKKTDNDVKINTYIRENANSTVFLLSTGFLIDNFEIRMGLHDFLVEEDQPFVYIDAADIESLTVPNPLVV